MYLKSIFHMGSLLVRFRNGAALVRHMRAGQVCDEVVLWDGTRIAHPADREGLLEGLQEIWLERIYTDDFYRPAPNDVIVDAGANVGLFTIYIARQNRRCRVLALEPFAENFKYLEANVARACLANVTCCEAALGAEAGIGQMEAVGTRSLDHVLRMNDVRREVRNSQIAVGGPQLASRDPRVEVPGGVRVLPLSGLFDLAGAPEIDFLKVDIEGSERSVFSAATADVLGRIQRIAMEYHDGIVPGTLEVVRSVLAPSHQITVRPSQTEGCGMLLARRRELKN